MALTIPLTDDEKEYIREIVGLGTSDGEMSDLESRLGKLNDARAASLRRDIGQWKKIEYGTTKTKGGIKGTDFDIERERLRITNKMRLTLNYPQVAYAGAGDLSAFVLNFGTRRAEDEYGR